MKVKAVVFDIAGTTVSDEGYVKDAFKRTFQKNGLTISDEEADSVMGYKKLQAIKILVSQNQLDWDSNKIIQVNDDFAIEMKNIYSEVSIYPLPGVLETFEWLVRNNIPFGLNTGFTREITNVVLNKVGWNALRFASAVVCSDEVAEGRPAPFMIQKLLSHFGIKDPKECLKVGDTEVDVLEGRNAGCGCVVAVTTGSYPRALLQNYEPDFIIDQMDELIPIISSYPSNNV
jgi:phosphonatase-like hydrolase